MTRIRLSWLMVLAVMAAILLVRPLRHQAIPVSLMLPRPTVSERGRGPFTDFQGNRWLRVSRTRAIAFARQRYPKDAAMLTAAALIANDEHTLSLLRQVGESMRYAPAFALYFAGMDKPAYERLGNSGVDPQDHEALAEAEERLRGSSDPDRLTPEQAAPVLEVLYAWQRADPENGLPLALEAYYLYGLHRDAKALERWEEASQKPRLTGYDGTVTRETFLLLSRLGMLPVSAAVMAPAIGSRSYRLHSLVRDAARIAFYEGARAALEGRPEQALRWWRSTSTLGRVSQESANDIIEFLNGIAIESIGASPAWQWCSDESTGIPGGPLSGGRFFFGPYHEFYVFHAGEAADTALRDRLIRAKLRVQLVRSYTEQGLGMDELAQVVQTLILGAGAAGLFVVLLIAYAVVSWRRPGARRTREALSLAAAVCAVALLAVLIIGARQSARWASRWAQPKGGEIGRIAAEFGPAWLNPKIPPDAWRAQFPPKVKSKSQSAQPATGTPDRAPSGAPE